VSHLDISCENIFLKSDHAEDAVIGDLECYKKGCERSQPRDGGASQNDTKTKCGQLKRVIGDNGQDGDSLSVTFETRGLVGTKETYRPPWLLKKTVHKRWGRYINGSQVDLFSVGVVLFSHLFKIPPFNIAKTGNLHFDILTKGGWKHKTIDDDRNFKYVNTCFWENTHQEYKSQIKAGSTTYIPSGIKSFLRVFCSKKIPENTWPSDEAIDFLEAILVRSEHTECVSHHKWIL
jgi:serine/threonine protein kinase